MRLRAWIKKTTWYIMMRSAGDFFACIGQRLYHIERWVVLNKILYYLMLFVFIATVSGCSESECRVGERICEGNVSRTCYNGSWRDVECVKSKPICDEKYGCVSVSSVCGNGNVEPEEECDGNDFNGKTCGDVFAGLVGELRCSDKCTLDTSSCVAPGCEEGMAICVDNALKTCELGKWRVMACEDKRCDAERGSCVERECRGEERRCTGGVAQLCIDDVFRDVMDCAGNGLICDVKTGLCASRICESGERRCLGTMMQLCVDNAFVDVVDCASKNQICQFSDGTCVDR